MICFINTILPWWLVIGCIIIGLGYASLLYLFKRGNNFPKWLKILLFGLRFFTVSSIAFLLLSPFVQHLKKNIEKPIIIFAQDNSESIFIKNTDAEKENYLKNIDEFLKKLKSKYEVEIIKFGSSVEPNDSILFSDKSTDISEVFNYIEQNFHGRNIASTIISSDGIYNKGRNPLFINSKYNINTIALGDTTVIPDIKILNTINNQIVFLGNDFPIEVDVKADKMAGSFADLQIFSGNKLVYTKRLNINANDYFETIKATLKAEKPGISSYKIVINSKYAETNKQNNQDVVYTEVIETKQNVVLIYSSPHPDIAAIYSSLKLNENINVEVVNAKDFSISKDEFDLYILHQIPDVLGVSTGILEDILKTNKPYFTIVGSNTDINYFNKYYSSIKLPETKLFDGATALLSENFISFNIEEDFKDLLKIFPPLKSPIGTYQTTTNSNIALYQKIGTITTKEPLLVFNTEFDNINGFLTGEGIWRWRLSTYNNSGNHKAFDDFISSIVTFLTVKSDKGKFRVKYKPIYDEFESIILNAEFYNDSYQLDNSSEVSVTLTDSIGHKYEHYFSKNADSYNLNIQGLPAGEYSFAAQTEVQNKKYTKTGKFYIKKNISEVTNLTANHRLLYQLASNNSGKMYTTSELDNLEVDILQNDEYKTIIHSQKLNNELINIKFVLFLIILLLSTEWFLRKYFGSY